MRFTAPPKVAVREVAMENPLGIDLLEVPEHRQRRRC